MKLVVGLGNPGAAYKNTRHNMGYITVQKLADTLGLKLKTKECKALTAVTSISGENVVLALPETYMNLSGESVRELLGKYNMTADDLLVVFDDIDIPLGSLRLRTEGSGGTHNGMKNIILNINNKNFKRVRIGIGEDRGEIPLADFVLGKPSKDGQAVIDEATDRAAAAIAEFLRSNDFEKIMRQFNA